MKQILAAEALGTAILVATVVGSGIMAARLAGGNDAVALIGNTAATAAILYVLISLIGPISGAQFNPAVTMMFGSKAGRGSVIVVQICAAIVGTLLAHVMFDHRFLEAGVKVRSGPGQWLGEAVATFGLLLTIRMGLKHRPAAVPALVAAWIVAGYWFTSSTSFANPAVTVARAFTDSFSGIRPLDVPGFIVAQIIGGATGYGVAGWLIRENAP